MAGANSRKTKANIEPAEPIEPSSPSKRARRASPSDKSSTASSTSLPTVATTPPTRTVPPTLTEAAPSGAAQSSQAAEASVVDKVDTDKVDNDADDKELDIPEYVTDEFIPRLKKLRTYVEPSHGRYSIIKIPPTVTWGTQKGDDRYLCDKGKKLLVWMLGVVRFSRLIDNKSYSIGLQPLSASEVDAAQQNNAGRCEPERPLQEDGTLTFANKWINSNNRTIKHKFPNVYDATDLDMQGWDDRRKVPAERIQVTDVVLMECYVRRYRTDGSKGPDWSVWGVNFELLRIAHLIVGPGPADEDPSNTSGAI